MDTTLYRLVPIILGCSVSLVGSYQCTSEYRPTVQICKSSYQSASAVLLDFKTFQTINADDCLCRIFINRGTRLYFNYLSSPGYYGCGTSIKITGESTSIISCLPAAQSLEVGPGQIVLVEILRTDNTGTANSDYCYSVEISDYSNSTSVQDGLYTIICDLPGIPSTTVKSISTSPTGSLTSTWKQTSTKLVPQNITTVPAESSSWFPHTTTTGVQKTPVTHNTVHLPWEIITPVSLLLLVLVVVAIVIYKMKKGRKRKTKLKMAMIAKHFHNSNKPLNDVPPDVADKTREKTGSGDYSILNENIVQTRAEIKVSEEQGADGIEEQRTEEKINESENSSKESTEEETNCEMIEELNTGLSEDERATLCASMDMIEQFIEETTCLALARFHRDRCSVVISRDNPQEDAIIEEDDQPTNQGKVENVGVELNTTSNYDKKHEIPPLNAPRSGMNDIVTSRRSNVPIKYNVRKSIQFWEDTIHTEGNPNVQSEVSAKEIKDQETKESSVRHLQKENNKENEDTQSEDGSEVSQDEVLEIVSQNGGIGTSFTESETNKIEDVCDSTLVIDVLALV